MPRSTLAQLLGKNIDSRSVLLARHRQKGQSHRPEAEGDHATTKPLHNVVIRFGVAL